MRTAKLGAPWRKMRSSPEGRKLAPRLRSIHGQVTSSALVWPGSRRWTLISRSQLPSLARPSCLRLAAGCWSPVRSVRVGCTPRVSRRARFSGIRVRGSSDGPHRTRASGCEVGAREHDAASQRRSPGDDPSHAHRRRLKFRAPPADELLALYADPPVMSIPSTGAYGIATRSGLAMAHARRGPCSEPDVRRAR